MGGLEFSLPKCTDFCSFLFWILLVYICIPLRVGGPPKQQNNKCKNDYGYCSSLTDRFISNFLHAVILYSIDVVCLGFMSWTSRYMVLTPHEPSNRLSHPDFPTGQSLRYYPDPSKRLCLLYCLSSILTLCDTLVVNPKQWLMDITVLTASCFPAFSTFLFTTC